MNKKVPLLTIIIILAVIMVSGCISSETTDMGPINGESTLLNLTNGNFNLINGVQQLSEDNVTIISDGKSEIEIGLKNTTGNLYDGKTIIDQGSILSAGSNYKYVVYNDSAYPDKVLVNVDFVSGGRNYFILAKVPTDDYNKGYLDSLTYQFQNIIGTGS